MAGVRVVLVSPHKHNILCVFSLTDPCSNNVVEHNALLIGLEIIREVRAKNLEADGDSMYNVNQVRGEYEVLRKDLIPYYEAASKMANDFDIIYIGYLPVNRMHTQMHCRLL